MGEAEWRREGWLENAGPASGANAAAARLDHNGNAAAWSISGSGCPGNADAAANGNADAAAYGNADAAAYGDDATDGNDAARGAAYGHATNCGATERCGRP